jgi:hypothetical protein
MPIVDLEVGSGSIRTRIPALGTSRRWPDQVTTIDDTIVDVGGEVSPTERAGWPERARTRAAFDAEAFEPELSAAVARYRTLRAINDAYPGWRSVFRVRGLSMTWPGWRHIPAADRRLVIERLAAWAPTVAINGAVVVGPRVDVPVLSVVLGRRIVPELD